MTRATIIVVTAGVLGLVASPASAGEPLVVHEWGTFTSLQDETGRAIGGINTDDEPVPPFVHRVSHSVLMPPQALPLNLLRSKGIPPHPQVTMRLETPVIYFHPPESQPHPLTVDVHVELRGGWLSEFYPEADADAKAFEERRSGEVTFRIFHVGELTSDEHGSLTWRSLRIGGPWAGPETTEQVWLAPRHVDAAAVMSEGGEAEKFLFYRGVANLDAPIQVTSDRRRNFLELRSQLPDSMRPEQPLTIPAAWLADIRPDGTAAYRKLGSLSLTVDANVVAATTAASFPEPEFSTESLRRLRKEMHLALVADGLFPDEASALLNTWEVAYFKSPGLRLFFLVPRAWTDHIMPLDISVPAELERVMVGRIELVTPQQRTLLRQIATAPVEDVAAFKRTIRQIRVDPARRQQVGSVFAGAAPLADLGVAVPVAYRAYAQLGRFKNALVLDELAQRPTPSLEEFVRANRLAYREMTSLTARR